jgi:hypothetical protein
VEREKKRSGSAAQRMRRSLLWSPGVRRRRLRQGSAVEMALKRKTDQGMSQMRQRPQKSQRGAVS